MNSLRSVWVKKPVVSSAMVLMENKIIYSHIALSLHNYRRSSATSGWATAMTAAKVPEPSMASM